MRWPGILILISALTGCSLGVCTPQFDPLPVERTGVMLPPRADGVLLECRGLERDRCLDMGNSDLPASVDATQVDRIVVSCVGRCTNEGGEMRMDVVHGDEATLIANGGYGEFEQSCAR